MSNIITTIAYSTDSAGTHSSHTLPRKLREIAYVGFSQVELAFSDLEAYAEQQCPPYRKFDSNGGGDLEKLMQAAEKIKELCKDLKLSILAVHPFSHFEGYRDIQKRAAGFGRASAWFKAVGCQMLQVGSTPDVTTSGDYDIIGRDLRQLADEAAAQDPPLRINTWEHAWEVCKRVDRPNFSLCLDTFQICARAYADPTSSNSLVQSMPQGSALMQLASSLRSLAATLPPDKIFYLQISDGSRRGTSDQLRKSAQEQGIDPLYAWSNAWRPLPYMDDMCPRGDRQSWGGYLPVIDVCDAVLRTGLERFMVVREDMSKDDPDIPSKWATATRESHNVLLKKLQERGF